MNRVDECNALSAKQLDVRDALADALLSILHNLAPGELVDPEEILDLTTDMVASSRQAKESVITFLKALAKL